MAKIVYFVYSMIIFLSLFLVTTKAAERIYRCLDHSHCPTFMCSPGLKPKCMNPKVCKCVPVQSRKYYALT
ncbi:putative Late nodulin [Medicago truncatula]|uniref:Nodule Cysteine-Rich (NCR) secreted peptide n=1 Tax=Medicago truncatula TaxID=3880 RepID=A0A072UUT3_MEDTR|nr:Nodule Cysteine-Rich (NCR) secreted peptide [Medicago truncatula]RHN65282.1 putative Late nodulin [Medicago truncatula]